MAGAGIFSQTIVGLSDIISPCRLVPATPSKAIFTGSANLFIPHPHGLSAGGIVDDIMKDIIKRTGIAPHYGWSAVNDCLNLLPFFGGYNRFMAIVNDFPVLTRDNIIGVEANPFLMCSTDKVCALIE